jgi:hypothetical protein
MNEATKKAAVKTATFGKLSLLIFLSPMATPATVKRAPPTRTGIDRTPSEMCISFPHAMFDKID